MTRAESGWGDRDAPAVLALDVLSVDAEERSAWRACGLPPGLALRARRAGLHPHGEDLAGVTGEQVDVLLALQDPVPPEVLGLLAEVRDRLADGDDLDARDTAVRLAQALHGHPARLLAYALNDAACMWSWADARAAWPHRERALLLADALAAALGATGHHDRATLVRDRSEGQPADLPPRRTACVSTTASPQRS